MVKIGNEMEMLMQNHLCSRWSANTYNAGSGFTEPNFVYFFPQISEF